MRSIDTTPTDSIIEKVESEIDIPYPNPELFKVYGPLPDMAAFRLLGSTSLRALLDFGELSPEDKLLDAGCGIGRVAIPLTRFLSPRGVYMGIDIIEPGIRWAQNNISSRYSNFSFVHIDVHNAMYNPEGELTASTFTFPFESNSFSLVFLFSVFTHLKPVDLTHYLSEIFRVLEDNGRLFATCFVLSEFSNVQLQNGLAEFPFFSSGDIYFTKNKKLHEAGIAYPQQYIEESLKVAGFDRAPFIKYGSWCKAPEAATGADLIVVRK